MRLRTGRPSLIHKLLATTFYRPQTKFAKVIFLQVSVCPRGGGGMRGCRGAVHGCVAGGGAFDCLLGVGVGACVVAGGVRGCGGTCMGAGGCAWVPGGVHGC